MNVMVLTKKQQSDAEQKSLSLFERALPYFIVAAVVTIRDHAKEYEDAPMTAWDVQSSWTMEIQDEDGKYTAWFLEDEELYRAAIKVCEQHELIKPMIDEFGPDYYLLQKDFQSAIASLELTYPLFHKYDKAGRTWLLQALRRIAKERAEEVEQRTVAAVQSISDTGVARDGADGWRPLPLERADPKFIKMAEALDTAIEAVRTDNGYNATYPGERQYVLSTLTSFREALKRETHITLGWVQLCALDPLGRAIHTLGNSASGTLLSVAKDLLRDWLKDLGKGLLT